MQQASLTRIVSFAAAHRYHRDDWSAERNQAVFGACNNPHGHGHNYRLAVTVEGTVDEETGFCVDLGVLDALLKRVVIEPLDHQHINHAIPEFGPGGMVPTSENIARYLWPRVADALPASARLRRLRLYEDDTLYVDYYGGSGGSGGSSGSGE